MAKMPDESVTPADENSMSFASHMKLGYLKMLVALDDTRMVSAAAAQMGISQPAASRMIAEMEQQFGTDVCERQPRGITLTTAGRALARRARTILLELNDAQRELAEIKDGRGGFISVGAAMSAAVDLVVPAVNRVRELDGRTLVNIQVDNSPNLIRDLLSFRLDFSVSRLPEDADPREFDARVIGNENARIVVRRGHPLLQQRHVTLDDLRQYDWVLQQRGTPMRRAIEALFARNQVPMPERIVQTSEIYLTALMVAQSNAICALGYEAARFMVEQPGGSAPLAFLPTDFGISIQPYALIKLKKRTLSDAASQLYDEIIKNAAAAGKLMP